MCKNIHEILPNSVKVIIYPTFELLEVELSVSSQDLS